MPQHLIILFVVTPMAAAITSLFLHGHRPLQRFTGITFLVLNGCLALAALVTVCGRGDSPDSILASQMGNWPAPFGITVVVDAFSAIMLAVEAFVCLATYIYCINQLPERFAGGFFDPLFHFLMLGVQWSFITGDLFNLFVAFEVMLMASYAMFVLGTTPEQMKQAYKYILLNLIGSTMFVTCAGLLYGQLGTLNMADITRLSMTGALPQSSIPVIVMFLLVFGGKAAIFPVWYWLPDTYHTMPAAIGGLFAGLLTKVGAYTLLRVFVMMFGSAPQVTEVITPIILVSAAVSMSLGVLGAVSMHSVRRILSIHIISQVGYMVMGVGLGIAAVKGLTNGEILHSRQLAVAGAIFFIVHNMVVKSSLFLCGGLMAEHAGSDDLDKIGGLLRRSPWLATLFLLAALSLAGLPPFSGFFGKWVLIRESLKQHQYTLAACAVVTSLLTLLSMLKIWGYGFWSPPRGQHVSHPKYKPNTRWGEISVAMLVAAALAMGLGAQSFLEASKLAAHTLIDPRAYIEAVLGEQFVPPRPTIRVVRSDETHTASPLTPEQSTADATANETEPVP
jgi:multicomponent Na+:H+ antiporter subunit D